MLGDAPVHATLPVVDTERAKGFYIDKLGLKLKKEDEGGVWLEAGEGSGLFLFKRAPTKADNTAAEFTVSNLESVVAGLKSKGVTFDHYDMPGVTWDGDIATMGPYKAVWFKDSEGNILSVSQTMS